MRAEKLIDWADVGPVFDAVEVASWFDVAGFPGTDQDAEDAGLVAGGQVQVAPLETHQADPTLQILNELGLVKAHQGGLSDKYDITCPWVDEHTGGQDDGAFYGVGGGGAFKCHHGHCQDKDIDDFRAALDELVSEAGGKRLRQREVKSEFEDLGEDANPGGGSAGAEAWVAELNRDFAIVGTGAGMRVLEKIEAQGELGIEWRFYSFAQFRERVISLPVLAPKTKQTGPGRPATKGEPMGSAWLRHPNARRYTRALVWPPGGTPCPADTYNMWQGWGVDPAPGAGQGYGGAEWPLIREFLFYVICGGDLGAYVYLVSWIAWRLQNPRALIGTAIALQGLPATGKGSLGKMIDLLYGRHALLTERGDDIVGRFNAILQDKLFVFADEALFHGDPKTAPKFRGMITNRMITIEGKGQAHREILNWIGFMIATNDLRVLDVQVHDRRLMVINTGTGQAHKVWDGFGDPGTANPKASERERDAYFDRLHAVLVADSWEMRTFMRDMLDLDLSGWKASDIPSTAAKTAQIGLSLRGVDRWLWELTEDDAPAPWSWVNGAGVDLSLGGGSAEGWMDAFGDGYAV